MKNHRLKIRLILGLAFLHLILPQAICLGATYYADPVNGSMSNDGSYNRPWRTAEEVFNSGLIGTALRAADTLLLRNGYHGEIISTNVHNSDYITIAAETGHAPHLKKVHFNSSSKWIIRGLTISPELAVGTYTSDYLIYISPDSYDIIAERNELFFTRDSSGWSTQDWNSLPARYMIYIRGAEVTIRDNKLKNMNFGIVITGEHALIEGNFLENIAGDGMVGSANNITIQYNTIKNFYRVNSNHDDAIQFHRGASTAPIYNAVIRSNLIIGKEPGLTNPLLGSPQGIACFEAGMPRNFVVENNVVIVDHWHGIAMYGAQNTRIVNNTLYNPYNDRAIWISLGEGGEGGQNCIVRNNMARHYTVPGSGNQVDHNIDTDNYSLNDLFINPSQFDLHLAQNSPAIDAGSGNLAPSKDIEGVTRPQGAGYDIGAYEYAASRPFVYGDVSGDGEVSAYDAALTAHIAVGLAHQDIKNRAAADVSGDGEVTAYDAALIAQRAVGLIDRFPVER